MQNSGLGNAANAIASLAVPYQIPFLMLISHRGGLGEFNVAQVGMGQALRPMLDGLGVQHYTLERQDEIEPVLKGASKLAFSTDRPVAIILSTLLTGGKEE
jgi:sulfopyruvate decarboxylase TPP-binding subunit